MSANAALKAIVSNVAANLPQMNDWLLRGFRATQVASMVSYLDQHFKSIELFHGTLVYVGYEVVSPPDRLRMMMTKSSNYRGRVPVQESSIKVVKFLFKFNERIFEAVVEIPYMVDNAIIVEGTKSYPLLVIVERVIHRIDNDHVMIKVARAPLEFHRVLSVKFKTTGEATYEEYVPTAKLHLGRGGRRRDKKPKFVPVVLYQLASFGFPATAGMYGIADGDIRLDEEPVELSGFTQVRIRDKLFLTFNKDLLVDPYKVRFICSIIRTLEAGPKLSASEIKESENLDHVFYRHALGEYISNATTKTQLIQQADEHINSNRTMIDPAAAAALASVGIECTDIHALLVQTFYQIDEWLVIRNPNDLYTKQLGSLSHMLASYVRMVMDCQYDHLRRGLLTESTITAFILQISTSVRHVANATFRTSSDGCSDCWLLTIGANKQRSTGAMERATSKRAPSALPVSALEPHPSELVVTSIFTIPSQSPGVGGTINPFAQIDQDGNFVKPPWANAIDHVFDC